jgi:tetratricopeptide (TPR) repeat protein
MRIKFQQVISALVLVAACSTSLASGGAPMGGGSMGSTGGMSSFSPRSPADEAKDFYNRGVHKVDKAKEHEKDAANAGSDEKKVAKALDKAQKSYVSALKDFQKATDKDEGLFQAWNYVGFCQRHLGHYEDALTAYGKALELNPNYEEAYEYRAEAYLGLNRFEDAKAAYMRLLANARPLADELMTSMHRWIEERQKDARGVGADDLAAFSKWVDERSEIAQQTASLWPDLTKRKTVDWK